ncbi:hypothetical protein DBR40_09040 [Pedobacter sp. KBW01]|uniref:hypothetical protein n=1 Tax=Pedobacter sp. KBW01 TaxID=2153364 RepID=UPI000F59D80A|nr:hypothetical protein [Pedobacter sp. KBW01]RQO78084.1 hypothetical protein DBR40_09040 [Pedobacter sp. KBW01]
MANLYQVKLKVYDTINPRVKYKPGTATVLVAVKNKAQAIELATDCIKDILSEKFPTAAVNLSDCKPINFDHYINPKDPK